MRRSQPKHRQSSQKVQRGCGAARWQAATGIGRYAGADRCRRYTMASMTAERTARYPMESRTARRRARARGRTCASANPKGGTPTSPAPTAELQPAGRRPTPRGSRGSRGGRDVGGDAGDVRAPCCAHDGGGGGLEVERDTAVADQVVRRPHHKVCAEHFADGAPRVRHRVAPLAPLRQLWHEKGARGRSEATECAPPT
jgi:hypothetical protein